MRASGGTNTAFLLRSLVADSKGAQRSAYFSAAITAIAASGEARQHFGKYGIKRRLRHLRALCRLPAPACRSRAADDVRHGSLDPQRS